MSAPNPAPARRVRTIALLAIVLPMLHGFAVFDYDGGGETLYLKWGDNHAGTPGGLITWSLIPAGTPGNAAYCGDACPGTALDALQLENFPGGGFTLTPLASFVPRIEAALARWSAVADIRFVRLETDSGVAINDPTAVPNVTGHLRIGVFAFASGGGAVGYAPPPNGGTGAGDILFDANSFYQFAPNAEGEPYDTFFAPNDFETLLLHELGHALGLAHPPVDGTCPVMQVDAACFGIVNREPDADDVAGLQFLYGPAPDTDGDGVPDVADNCTLVANPGQRDTNGDGFGNLCDADLNDDGVVNASDLGLLRVVFFTADPDADFNGDGAVNPSDLGIMRAGFFAPPGPSGIAP